MNRISEFLKRRQSKKLQNQIDDLDWALRLSKIETARIEARISHLRCLQSREDNIFKIDFPKVA